VSTVIGRIFRIVRTPITLLVLLGVLCYAAWWGYTNVLRPIPPAPAQPCVDQSLSKGQLKSSQVTVKVYNGGNKRGLAGDVGRALRDRGFNVIRTTNTAEKISRTVIVGVNPKSPEVLLVKGFFKDALVKGDKRVDHTVDVLVGNKYAGFNKGAKRTYTVNADTLCLPSQASTTSAPLGG
jgi:LytR cell envelope-related transcriptional attenuator